jgi:hypothetical protein
MSVTNVRASPFPTTPPPPTKSNTHDDNAVNNAPSGITNGATNDNVTRNAVNGVTTGNATNVANPPPTQAAITPGTRQKVDIIA